MLGQDLIQDFQIARPNRSYSVGRFGVVDGQNSNQSCSLYLRYPPSREGIASLWRRKYCPELDCELNGVEG